MKPEARDADCVLGLVTVIETVPALPAGDVARIWVELATVTAVDGEPPNLTVAPAWKPLPVRVTAVPPELGPDIGEAPETLRVVGLV